ncbi:MAG TPA: DNA-binding response regulator [Amycolatopsis sp.]|nr:DNA-binding response regulator [Amycolatopsis sp.]
MELTDVAVMRDEQELFDRTAHLFNAAAEIACAANDLHTWALARAMPPHPVDPPVTKRVRKVYRPGALLDPASAAHLRHLTELGVPIRISDREINETILVDRKMAILAGQDRRYSVITRPDLVRGIESLFEAAWHGATDLAAYDAKFAELREQAPRILELLSSGCKDETAARTLGVGLRTYRRRVAELMDALGATSRFQAGARARDAGLL